MSTSNPSSLPARYQIRKLTRAHSPWANAIVMHSNAFHSPVWPLLYPTAPTTLLHDLADAGSYLIDHQIDSGLSYGIFDTEYAFRRPESEKAGGALYWDRNEPSVLESQGMQAESDRLLEQMDFPLVSVALSYDGADPLDMEKMGPMIACLPAFGTIYGVLGHLDTRDPASWQPTGPGQVLMRNATSTRHDYEGQGIMAGLARWLMREVAAKGYRGIQIETLADAVKHVWGGAQKADPKFRSEVVAEFSMESWVDEEGTKVFAPATQLTSKVFVHLKEGE